MKKMHVYYSAFFVIAFASFVYIDIYGPAWLSRFEDGALVLLITLFGSLLIYVDFREKRSKKSISKALAVLWVVNATLAAFLFLVGFAATSALIVPVFMLEGALLYYWLESMSDAGSSAPRRE